MITAKNVNNKLVVIVVMIPAVAVLLVAAATFAVEDAQAEKKNKAMDKENQEKAKSKLDENSAFNKAKSKQDDDPVAPIVIYEPPLPHPDEVCAECKCCKTDGGS